MARAVHVLRFFCCPLFLLLFVLRSEAFPLSLPYDEHFAYAGRFFGIPKLLLGAIAKQESSFNPLVVNIAGRDHHPKNPSEALLLIREAEARGKSFDVGIMQINRYWLRKYRVRPELLLLPENNIFLGALILHKELQRRGFSWTAVGHYHSHTSWRAADYAGKIRRHLEGFREAEVMRKKALFGKRRGVRGHGGLRPPPDGKEPLE